MIDIRSLANDDRFILTEELEKIVNNRSGVRIISICYDFNAREYVAFYEVVS